MVQLHRDDGWRRGGATNGSTGLEDSPLWLALDETGLDVVPCQCRTCGGFALARVPGEDTLADCRTCGTRRVIPARPLC